jgi:hypothetical protein
VSLNSENKYLKLNFKICLSFEVNFILGFRLESISGDELGRADMNYELE